VAESTLDRTPAQRSEALCQPRTRQRPPDAGDWTAETAAAAAAADGAGGGTWDEDGDRGELEDTATAWWSTDEAGGTRVAEAGWRQPQRRGRSVMGPGSGELLHSMVAASEDGCGDGGPHADRGRQRRHGKV